MRHSGGQIDSVSMMIGGPELAASPTSWPPLSTCTSARLAVVYFVHAVRDDGAALSISGTREKLICEVLGISSDSAAAFHAAIRETSSLPPESWQYSEPGLPTDSITYGAEGNSLTLGFVPGTIIENGLASDIIEEYRDFMAAFIGTRLYIKQATLVREPGRTSTVLQSEYNLLPLVGIYRDPDEAMGVLESIFPRKVKKVKRY